MTLLTNPEAVASSSDRSRSPLAPPSPATPLAGRPGPFYTFPRVGDGKAARERSGSMGPRLRSIPVRQRVADGHRPGATVRNGENLDDRG
jgi:hypothetical protein